MGPGATRYDKNAGSDKQTFNLNNRFANDPSETVRDFINGDYHISGRSQFWTRTANYSLNASELIESRVVPFVGTMMTQMSLHASLCAPPTHRDPHREEKAELGINQWTV